MLRGFLTLIGGLLFSLQAFAAPSVKSFQWHANSKFILALSNEAVDVVIQGSLRDANNAQVKSGEITVDLKSYIEGFVTIGISLDGENDGYVYVLERQNSLYIIINSRPILAKQSKMVENLDGIVEALKKKNNWDASQTMRSLVDYFNKNGESKLENYFDEVELGNITIVPKPRMIADGVTPKVVPPPAPAPVVTKVPVQSAPPSQRAPVNEVAIPVIVDPAPPIVSAPTPAPVAIHPVAPTVPGPAPQPLKTPAYTGIEVEQLPPPPPPPPPPPQVAAAPRPAARPPVAPAEPKPAPAAPITSPQPQNLRIPPAAAAPPRPAAPLPEPKPAPTVVEVRPVVPTPTRPSLLGRSQPGVAKPPPAERSPQPIVTNSSDQEDDPAQAALKRIRAAQGGQVPSKEFLNTLYPKE